jgi:formamidopyrimidine-DNA glycosylase
MPELPEVEIAARNLDAWARGRSIVRTEADEGASRIFRPATAQAFAAAVTGHRVEDVQRVGKHILVRLAGPRAVLGLHSHLGMTGKWLRRTGGEPAPGHSRARLHLDDGSVLHYRDPRLFGRLRLVPGARFEEVPEIASLGPDPLQEGIDVGRLAAALARRRAAVKLALLDQRLLPGVGNIIACESLSRARIDPRREARSLSRAEVRRLAGGVLASVRETIAREQGAEITYVEESGAENPFRVYGREGERCPACRRGTIRRLAQGGRSTFFCPRCQR